MQVACEIQQAVIGGIEGPSDMEKILLVGDISLDAEKDLVGEISRHAENVKDVVSEISLHADNVKDVLSSSRSTGSSDADQAEFEHSWGP
eukprot:CAMPEP_0180190876 /NCGR_PEP_ID=MMETSP0987-20121128/1127_1 /TAXON_ID=697907 /ORGANISM="non described non described, Strain CCMP2293" /LENGTH=89 /DNA_ID=CAMNT_0022145359 /DNA_START=356 /DNA_END=621 /DNA_ORIENTATION=+